MTGGNETADLFSSPQWSSLLERAFRVRTLEINLGQDQTWLHVFPAGPFGIGYLRFPVGGTRHMPQLPRAHLAVVAEAGGQARVDVLRISQSAFPGKPETLERPVTQLPQTAIPTLKDWNLEGLKGRERWSLRRAERSGLKVQNDPGSVDASQLYALYAATVARHRGARRYNPDYFRGLLEIAEGPPLIRTFSAHRDGALEAIVIIGSAGRHAAYLHGFASAPGRRDQASELTLAAAIQWCRDAGLEWLDMLASPADQPGLVQYKEKWGGVTRMQDHYELALRPGRAFCLRSAVRLRSAVSGLAGRFSGP